MSSNLIQQENAKPGTTAWQLTNPGWATGTIEGYASLTSVNRGGRIKFFVNTIDPSYTLQIFRIGYYQGLHGRSMLGPVTLPGTRQVIPTPDPTTGLLECNWTNPFILDVPNSADPTDWMSGFYYVKLTGSSGKQQYITFVVRDDARASDLILAQTVTTAQAYNVWGGKSLYGTIAVRSDPANAARKVSFDRPYYGDETSGAGNFSSRIDYGVEEWGMVGFLESNGYDVTYATNIDVDRDSNLLLSHKAFLSVGHDEYWSWAMRDHVEHARDVGVNLGFFSGNTSYWQVRFENSISTQEPWRVMVGYKDSWQDDPILPAYLKTARFRSNPPVNRSEDRMIGVMYITQARSPFVVEDASNWVMSGTGLKNGDVLTNPDGSYFVGYEVDAMSAMSPGNTQRLGHSPATANRANFSDMVVYRAASGATVFATGTILWSWSVPQIVQITRNVLARFVSGAFSDTPAIRPPLPQPFQAADIGDTGRYGFVSLAGADSFTLNGAGQPFRSGTDNLYYVYASLAGNGEIITRVTALQLFWDNRAGLMIRESLSPSAKYVSVVARPSESRAGTNPNGVNEGVEMYRRSTAGALPSLVAAHDLNMPNWLRLVRSGDTFTGYLSADGASWQVLGTVTVPMASTVLIGASVNSVQYGVWATASFDNLRVSTVSAGPAPPPPTAPSPTSSSTVTSSTTSTSGCSTPDPFVAMGGGTCYNGGWLPPGMQVPSTSTTTTTTTVTSTATATQSGCATPDPFVAMGGGTCYNGGWLPPGMAIPSGSTATAPAPTVTTTTSTKTGCLTPDPFVAMGGGTCYNGGWLPPGMSIPGGTTAPAPAPAPTSSGTSTCTTPDPFASIPNMVGMCVNGGWIPLSVHTGTARLSSIGTWKIIGDDGITYVPVAPLDSSLNGVRVSFAGVVQGTAGGQTLIQIMKITRL